jgi:hypothetical protein
MGADLIGYLVKGPAQIIRTEEEIKSFYHDQCMFYHENYADHEAYIATDEVLQLFDEEENLYMTFESEAEFVRFIEDFLWFWNSGGTDARDCNSRFDPDDVGKQIMFCGDMSWGDSPEGFGYTHVDQICRCGFQSWLGLH